VVADNNNVVEGDFEWDCADDDSDVSSHSIIKASNTKNKIIVSEKTGRISPVFPVHLMFSSGLSPERKAFIRRLVERWRPGVDLTQLRAECETPDS